MLIGLFSLFYALVIGAPDSPYIVPKAEKAIIASIADKDRKKEMKTMTKSFVKEWKAQQKLLKKNNKEINKMIVDRTIDQSTIENKADDSLNELIEFHDRLTTMRLTVQAFLTDDEWDVFVSEIQDVKPKKIEKQSKNDLKTRLKSESKIQAFRASILENLDNQEEKDRFESAIDDFEEDMSSLLYESQSQADRVVDMMYGKDASKDELEILTTNIETFKTEYIKSFLDLRQVLIDISDDNTWPKIGKSMAKLID